MKVGPYEIEGVLGRGASGSVHRARAADGRVVALKLLQRVDKDTVARFERERRLLATLGDAHGFVPLLDAGDSPHGPWIVMPLLEGGTLRGRFEDGPLSIDEALSLGRALAAALARAHERGIVHRDLKPENVLFAHPRAEGGAGADPLVADLGIAKHIRRDLPGASQSVALSRVDELRGTPGYMAPEVLRDGSKATAAADVFGLGAILYEALAGTPAFISEDDSVVTLLVKVASGITVPLSKARPDTPAWLARVVTRALAPDPAARFADAGELARALAGPGEGARTTGATRILVAVIALAAVGAALAVAFSASAISDRFSAGGGQSAPADGDAVAPSSPLVPLTPEQHEGATTVEPWGPLLDAEEARARALALEHDRKPARALRAWYRVLDSTRAGPELRQEAMAHARALSRFVPANTDPSRAAVWRVKVLRGGAEPIDAFDRADLAKTLEAWKKAVFEWTRGELRLELDEEELARPIAKISTVDDQGGALAVYPTDLPIDVVAQRFHETHDSVVVCAYLGKPPAEGPRARPHWFMRDAGRFANGFGMLQFYTGELANHSPDSLLASWLHHVRVAFSWFQGFPRELLADPGAVDVEAKGCDCPEGLSKVPGRSLAEHLVRDHVTDRMWRSASTLRVERSCWNTGDVHVWRVVAPTPYSDPFAGSLLRTTDVEDERIFGIAASTVVESKHRALAIDRAFPGSPDKPNRGALLQTWVKVPRTTRARLVAGGARAIRVALDGKAVVTRPATDGTLEESSAEVELSSGWHRVGVKVTTDGTGMAVAVRIVDSQGVPINGLELAPDKGH